MDYEVYRQMFPEMAINDLNDDCMMSILQWVPLAELLRLEIVCRRWKVAQECLFRSRKNKLVLVDSNLVGAKNPLQEIKNSFISFGINIAKSHHHLRVDLSEKNAQLLLTKFPNICHLEVVYDRLDCIEKQLSLLLDAWKENMIHLKVIIYDSSNTEAMWKRLFPSITKLSKLKHLTVKDIYANQRFHPNAHGENSPACAQLPAEFANGLEEYFFALSCERMSNVFAQLNQLSGNRQMKKLALVSTQNRQTNEVNPPRLENIDEEFAGKVTDLTLNWRQEQRQRHLPLPDEEANPAEEAALAPFVTCLQTICFSFCSLTSLHLNMELEFSKMAPKLIRLKRLTDLRLPFSLKIFPNTRTEDRLQPLNSIINLTLDCKRPDTVSRIENIDIPHTELIFIEHLLPHLATIKLNLRYDIGDHFCRVCNSREKEVCRNAFLGSLVNFSKLRRVYLLESDGYTGWQEIFSQDILARYNVIYMLDGRRVLAVDQTMRF